MEGKELYNNEDEDFNSKSKKEDDSDDFGLPEIEESESKTEDLGDPYSDNWEEKKEDPYSSDTYGSTEPESTEQEYGYNEEVEGENTEGEYKSSYYEEEYGQKKSPVGWIVFGIIAVLAVIIGVIWWFNREPEPAPVVQKPIIEETIVEPEPEPEPTPAPEPVKQAGVFEINQPTGRYYVIVASSIDKDLVHDYGKKLAKQGMTCNILAPRGNKKFHRLAVADYVSLNDASLKSEQLKSTLGGDVWVIRY